MSSFSAERLFRSLPRSPDLEQLKEEAKSLKKAWAQADPQAAAFLQSHLGRAPEGLQLAEAQFALARSYGFKSWPRLKAFVEVQLRTPRSRPPCCCKPWSVGTQPCWKSFMPGESTSRIPTSFWRQRSAR